MLCCCTMFNISPLVQYSTKDLKYIQLRLHHRDASTRVSTHHDEWVLSRRMKRQSTDHGGITRNDATGLPRRGIPKFHTPRLSHTAHGEYIIPVGMHHGLKCCQPSSRLIVVTNTMQRWNGARRSRTGSRTFLAFLGMTAIVTTGCRQVKIGKDVKLVCHGGAYHVLSRRGKEGGIHGTTTIVLGNGCDIGASW